MKYKFIKSTLFILILLFNLNQCGKKAPSYKLTIDFPNKEDQAKGKTLSFITGSKEGTYYPVALSMTKIFKDIKFNLKTSEGSIQNIKEVGSGKKDLGIIQSDNMALLKESMGKKFKKISKFEVILPLFLEEVHIIVNKNKDIKTIADLKGKKVALGLEKSGTFQTALFLLKQADIDPKKDLEMDHSSPKSAIKKVNAGELDAMFFIGGHPIPFLAKLKEDESNNITMISSRVKLKKNYPIEPYIDTVIPASSYSWLDKTVPVYSTTALLIGKKGMRKELVLKICNRVLGSLEELGKSHPKWKQVNYYRIKRTADKYGNLFNDGTLIYLFNAEDSIELKKKEKSSGVFKIETILLSKSEDAESPSTDFKSGDDVYYKVMIKGGKSKELNLMKSFKVFLPGDKLGLYYTKEESASTNENKMIELTGQFKLPKDSPRGSYEIEFYVEVKKSNLGAVKKQKFQVKSSLGNDTE